MTNACKSVRDRVLNRPQTVMVVIVVLMCLNCFQGIEMTDEGFWGCFYQQIFVAPRSVTYNFLYWFTGVVGGVLNVLVPSGGVLGFRILGVLTVALSMVLSFVLLKPYVDRRLLTLGFILVGGVQHSMVNIFYEKNWCGFLAIGLVFCLHRGLIQRKSMWLFMAGIIGAVCTMSRVPCAVLFALGAGIFFYGIMCNLNMREQMIFAGWFAIGGLVGFLALATLMIGLGHWDVFIGAFQFMLELAADSSGDVAHHGWKALLILLGSSALNSLIKGGGIGGLVVVAACGIVVVRRVCVRPLLRSFGVMMGLLVFFLAILFLTWRPFDSVAVYACIIGIALLLGMSPFWGSGSEYRLLCMLVLGAAILSPLGSNVMLSVLRYTLWLSLPLAMDMAYRILRALNASTANRRSGSFFNPCAVLAEVHGLLMIVIMTLLAVGLYYCWNGIYRDAGGRLNMTAQVRSPAVRGVFTGRARSEALNQLLGVLGQKIRPGDELLVFANMPMLHMLTETRPYLGMSWVKALSASQLRSSLEKAASIQRELPIVVVHKRNVGEATWPTYASAYLSSPYVADRFEVMREFLRSHRYNCVWENDEFLVWSPLPNDGLCP